MTHSETPETRAAARTVVVSDDRDGQRLDNFLLGQLKGAPRSLVYKLVRSGQVRVNGGRAKADRKLEGGDKVRIPPVRLEEEGDKPTPPKGFMDALDAAIVYEDARLLALNKPSGVASHGGSGISFGAIETLRALRPGQSLELVHRLDRDTSGVLMLAKKRSALTGLHAQLREGAVRKHYLALVLGQWTQARRSVKAGLHKYVSDGGERRVVVDDAGQQAHTIFRLVRNVPGYSLLDAELKTGRTHQIRVHLASLGTPIVGDFKYGGTDAKGKGAIADKLHLHARSIDIARPDGGRLNVIAPLSPHMVKSWELLGFDVNDKRDPFPAKKKRS
jgi:23S rRNA pseudouridine955/2504/2580 synthase